MATGEGLSNREKAFNGITSCSLLHPVAPVGSFEKLLLESPLQGFAADLQLHASAGNQAGSMASPRVKIRAIVVITPILTLCSEDG